MTDTLNDVPRDALVRHLRDSLGQSARLRKERGTPLLTVEDSPEPGVESHATLGLSALPLRLDDGTIADHGAEIVLASIVGEEGAGLLADIAQQVTEHGKALVPDMILTDALKGRAGVAPHLRHILLSAPFLWNTPPAPLRLPERLVLFLQAIPISEAERALAAQDGAERLEDLLEEAEADILDFERESVV
ncbi:hypothetical protein CG51_02885 [Haematobacter missouriensis]|uniref:Suppressor of fused-like domain-containing protein n=1 Tax=Haematobacter missouriensis TaxID=366616 RepID=A0A212ASP8_9RHOB|nr:suppressor of fused domain protein [Haematobacter missouriensis]KFI32326.1 hypothetical protein CG51_02885 [Haematobacter missouriensis]OWJ75262.1 hypothetical protein CDV53_11080 [Haematobacter missouriensis]OWJ84503.1 hypothetical protein CDV52_07400 [Haematobacter missouriensis]